MEAFLLTQQLRSKGIAAEKDYLSRSLKAQMKGADRMQAKYVVIIGDEEIEKRQAVVREMATSEQTTVAILQNWSHFWRRDYVMLNMKRTHNCNDLRKAHIGQEVVLMGWAQKRRDHGGVIFIDLRDRSGVVQVTSSAETSSPECFTNAGDRAVQNMSRGQRYPS